MTEFKTRIVIGNVVLTSGFRVPERPTHHGIDLGARPRGKPAILAFNDGFITLLQRNNPTAGNWLEIAHNDGFISTYMHLDTIAPGIMLGIGVDKGQPIGTMGTTGKSKGIHLHFELRREKQRDGGLNAIDPLPFITEVEDMRYRTLADIPKRDREHIQNLITIGIISGTGRTPEGEMILDLTDDMIRGFTFMQNMIRFFERNPLSKKDEPDILYAEKI